MEAITLKGIMLVAALTVKSPGGYTVPHEWIQVLPLGYFTSISGCKEALKEPRTFRFKRWQVVSVSCLPWVDVRR